MITWQALPQLCPPPLTHVHHVTVSHSLCNNAKLCLEAVRLTNTNVADARTCSFVGKMMAH